MKMLTNEQLNDPCFFDKPEYDADKRASYERALNFYNGLKAQAKENSSFTKKRK